MLISSIKMICFQNTANISSISDITTNWDEMGHLYLFLTIYWLHIMIFFSIISSRIYLRLVKYRQYSSIDFAYLGISQLLPHCTNNGPKDMIIDHKRMIFIQIFLLTCVCVSNPLNLLFLNHNLNSPFSSSPHCTQRSLAFYSKEKLSLIFLPI